MANVGFEPLLAPVSGTIFLCCLSHALCKIIQWYHFPESHFVNMYQTLKMLNSLASNPISPCVTDEMVRLASLHYLVVSVAFQPFSLKPCHYILFLPFLPIIIHSFFSLHVHDHWSRPELSHRSDYHRGLKLTSFFTGPAFPNLCSCQIYLSKSQSWLYNSPAQQPPVASHC